MDLAMRRLIDAETEIQAHATALSAIEESIQRGFLSVRIVQSCAFLPFHTNVAKAERPMPLPRHFWLHSKQLPPSNMSDS